MPSPRPVRRFAVLALAAAFAGALVVGSAAPSRAEEPAAGGDTVELRFDAGITVPDFLKSLAQAVGKPILWLEGDRTVTGRRFSSTGSLVVPRARALEAARALLVPLEMVLVPLGPEGAESYFAVNAREQMSLLRLKAVPVEVNDESALRLEKQDGLFVSAVIRVRDMDNLRDARQALSRIVTQNNIGQITEVPGAKTFIVTDFAPTVVSIYRVLRMMDTRPVRDADPAPEVIRLRHARAVPVASILREQFEPRKVAAQPGPALAAADSPDVRISADDDANQVIVTSPAATLERIRRVIESLDVDPGAK
jgi:hypothetical protein